MKQSRKRWKLGRADLATDWFDVNRDYELVVREGNYQYNLFDLVKKFGSPLEVAMPFVVEQRLSELMAVFNRLIKSYRYRGKFFYHYPMKASQNKEFVLPIISEGGNLEVTSANELWIVKRMWEQEQFSSHIRVICNGPKTNQYLALIFELRDKGLSITPIIEDKFELAALSTFKGDVGIRLDPQVKVHARWDKKVNRFGLTAEEILSFGRIRNLKLLHYHTSKQLVHQEDIVAPLKKAMALYIKLRSQNPTLDMIDLGGGMPVPFEKKPLFSVEGVAKRILRTVQRTCDRANIPHPDILVEWGSYLVAPAQVTLYRILSEKNINNHAVASKWYIIDGSFINDLKDTWAIHQKWHIMPANRLNAVKMNRVWLAGLSCDSDDKYTGGNFVSLPPIETLEEGEQQFIAVFDTGAYQDALSSHHCLLSSPMKIIVQNGVITVARKRETPEEVGREFGW